MKHESFALFFVRNCLSGSHACAPNDRPVVVGVSPSLCQDGSRFRRTGVWFAGVCSALEILTVVCLPTGVRRLVSRCTLWGITILDPLVVLSGTVADWARHL